MLVHPTFEATLDVPAPLPSVCVLCREPRHVQADAAQQVHLPDAARGSDYENAPQTSLAAALDPHDVRVDPATEHDQAELTAAAPRESVWDMSPLMVNNPLMSASLALHMSRASDSAPAGPAAAPVEARPADAPADLDADTMQ